MQTRPKPDIFLTFANDRTDPDRNLAALPAELAALAQALAPITGPDDSWRLLPPQIDCTPDDLLHTFSSHSVAIFHYAGHANPEKMLLETAIGANQEVSRPSVEQFFAQQKSLKLVFLNACSTRAWAQGLVQLGVPCVIATSRPIQDSLAPKFARAFYDSLVEGCTIAQAFAKASTGLAVTDEHTLRSLGHLRDSEPAVNGIPWALYTASPTDAAPSPSAWTLGDGANDPLIGLPQLAGSYYTRLDQKAPRPDSPYVTLKGHTENEAALFFGRNAEIRELFDWVHPFRLQPQAIAAALPAPPILLFYGQSGVGKSSLLSAGLLPRLMPQVPVEYRRRARDLTQDLHAALGGPTNEHALTWLSSPKPTLIILDQVEEAITHNDGAPGELNAFLARIVEIFTLRPATQARLILSFRKEYLAEIRNALLARLEIAAPNHPPLLRDLWLQRLDSDAIRQVVLGPVRVAPLRARYRLTISDAEALAAQIAADVNRDPKSPVATILQIVLGKLWDAALKESPDSPTYTQSLYGQLGSQSNPLQSFYDEQVKALGPTLPSRDKPLEIGAGLGLDFLMAHTSPMVASCPKTLAELQELFPQVSPQQLTQLLSCNKDLHLLADSAPDPLTRITATPAPESEPDSAELLSAATPISTLAHDTLAGVIRREFEISQLPGARARRLLENRARDWQLPEASNPSTQLAPPPERRLLRRKPSHPKPLKLKAGDRDPLDSADLKVVERGLPHMRAVTPSERWLLDESRSHRTRRRRAAQAAVLLVCAATYGVLVTLKARDTEALVQLSRQPGADPLSALLWTLSAAANLQDSWIFRTSHPTLKNDVDDALRSALRTPEVFRYPMINAPPGFEACAVLLGPDHQPVATQPPSSETDPSNGVLPLASRIQLWGSNRRRLETAPTQGSRSGLFAGKPLPEKFAQSILACDPQSRVIAFLKAGTPHIDPAPAFDGVDGPQPSMDPGPARDPILESDPNRPGQPNSIVLWKDGSFRPVPLPPGVDTTVATGTQEQSDLYTYGHNDPGHEDKHPVPGLTAIELSPGADRLELRRSRGTDQTFDLSTGTLWSTPSYKQSRRQSVWQFSSPTNPLGIPSASLIQVGRIGSERFVVAAGVFGLKFFQLEVSSAQPALRLVYSIPEATGITALAISPDGSRVAWATSDRTIKVLLVPSPLSLFAELELDNAALEARQAANNDFGNTPPPAEDPRQTLERDRLIARGKIILDRIDQASDAPVQVAHNRTGTPKPELWIIQNISVAGTTQTLSFSPDNRLLASSAGPEGRRGGDGVIYVYQLSRQNLQKIFFNRGVSPPLSYSFHLACTEVAPYLRYMAGRTQVPIDNIDFHSLQKSCAAVLKPQ